jgi:hypothetical protein
MQAAVGSDLHATMTSRMQGHRLLLPQAALQSARQPDNYQLEAANHQQKKA